MQLSEFEKGFRTTLMQLSWDFSAIDSVDNRVAATLTLRLLQKGTILQSNHWMSADRKVFLLPVADRCLCLCRKCSHLTELAVYSWPVKLQKYIYCLFTLVRVASPLYTERKRSRSWHCCHSQNALDFFSINTGWRGGGDEGPSQYPPHPVRECLLHTEEKKKVLHECRWCQISNPLCSMCRATEASPRRSWPSPKVVPNTSNLKHLQLPPTPTLQLR